MTNLIAGIDSDIGKALLAELKSRDEEVYTTSRNRIGDYYVELNHPYEWPKFTQKFDKVYYTVGIHEGRSSRMEVMQVNCFATLDFLNYVSAFLNPGAQVVVLTSGWGSIASVDNTQAQWYRMSKAALNMGIAVMAKRRPHFKWTLMQPGFVRTKMTSPGTLAGTPVATEVSARGIVDSSQAVEEQFCFIDYRGERIPF